MALYDAWEWGLFGLEDGLFLDFWVFALVFFYAGSMLVSLGLGGISLGCFLWVASMRLTTPSLGILLVLSLNLSRKFECISSIIK